ncbi:MAG TPA: four helix bundle protein [Gemmatimonadaceae bacterium]|nr:four helix bundle protein [Gemmatimonadaceae bacterium]
MGDYKKLRVWKEACDFADRVSTLVDTLPRHVRDQAREQLVPAAAAVHENIAEGCGLNSDRQLLKYLRQALGTANESEDELLALDRAGHVTDQYRHLLDDVRRLCAMLAVFIRTVETSESQPRPRRPPKSSWTERQTDSRADSRADSQ